VPLNLSNINIIKKFLLKNFVATSQKAYGLSVINRYLLMPVREIFFIPGIILYIYISAFLAKWVKFRK